MTSLRTLLVCICLSTGVCDSQSNAAPPNGSFGFSFTFIKVDVAPDQRTPSYAECWLVGPVIPDSPAARGGIKPGDKILYVNGTIATRAAFEAFKAADTADLLLQRPDQTIYAAFRLHRATGLNLTPQKNAVDPQQVIDGYLAIERNIQKLLADKAESSSAAPPDTAAFASAQPDPPPSNTPAVGGIQSNGSANPAAMAANARIAGTWAGGKSEHDYLHGGYVSADWKFTFAANGTYEEIVYVGGQEGMSAGGTYTFAAASKPGDRTVTHMLSFQPGSVEYTNNDLARVAASFPVPIKAAVREYVNFFRLSDGNTMMLQDADRSGSENWQMKAH